MTLTHTILAICLHLIILCYFSYQSGSNIFVSSNGIIKLGDFGSAVRLKDPLHTMQGEVANVRGTAGKKNVFIYHIFLQEN